MCDSFPHIYTQIFALIMSVLELEVQMDSLIKRKKKIISHV